MAAYGKAAEMKQLFRAGLVGELQHHGLKWESRPSGLRKTIRRESYHEYHGMSVSFFSE